MSKPTKVPKPGPVLVWLTRDSNHETGGLFDSVDVWCVRPDRYTDECGVFWLANKDDDRLKRVKLPSRRFPTIPDDDRQCIRLYLRKV